MGVSLAKEYPLVCGSQHPLLRKVCEPVDHFGYDVQQLGELLINLMREYEGVGIAAPQIGITKRIAAFTQRDMSHDDRELILEEVMVNPVLLSMSEEVEIAEEGCLSLPGVKGHVARPSQITLQYYTTTGEKKILSSSGYNARIILHEIDHLDGILFIDKLV